MCTECQSITLAHQTALRERMSLLQDRISEYTFSNLFLYNHHYRFHVEDTDPKRPLIVYGEEKEEKFAFIPEDMPNMATLEHIFNRTQYLRAVPERLVLKYGAKLLKTGYTIIEDRDHFDYLYSRNDLASLQGKKYHKKRNLVHQFTHNYSFEVTPLNPENKAAAFDILQNWKKKHREDADFDAAHCALTHMEMLGLQGILVTVDTVPVGYSLGEIMQTGDTYLVHSEKALTEYKGSFQFLNMMCAQSLPETCTYINREQDLGIEGLRQAKMTYRPIGFIKKYRIHNKST